jgi:hypothetical protein
MNKEPNESLNEEMWAFLDLHTDKMLAFIDGEIRKLNNHLTSALNDNGSFEEIEKIADDITSFLHWRRLLLQRQGVILAKWRKGRAQA